MSGPNSVLKHIGAMFEVLWFTALCANCLAGTTDAAAVVHLTDDSFDSSMKKYDIALVNFYDPVICNLVAGII